MIARILGGCLVVALLVSGSPAVVAAQTSSLKVESPAASDQPVVHKAKKSKKPKKAAKPRAPKPKKAKKGKKKGKKAASAPVHP